MSYHTVYPIVGMVHLLSAICFCISSYVHQQMHSLDCQHFVHYISLVLFTFLRTPHGCRVSFLKGTKNFQNCLSILLVPDLVHGYVEEGGGEVPGEGGHRLAPH